MRTALFLLIATGASALAQPAAAQRGGDGEAELAKAIAGRVPGKPVNCISAHPNHSSRIIDGTAIVYGSGRTVYVNRPRGGANSLDDDDILVTRVWGGQLCRQDTVQLFDRMSRIPGGFVILDRFVPYTRPSRR